MGRVLGEKRTIGTATNTINYQYNLDGSLWKLQYPGSAKTITYTYTGAARALKAVNGVDGVNYVTGATYAPFGGLTGMTNGFATGFTGIVTADSYNSRLQPAVISAAIPSGTLYSFGYDLHLGAGDNGNVYQIANNVAPNRTQNFIYDSLNRIQQAYTNGPNWGETYAPIATNPGVAPATPGIDAWGNLTQRSGVVGKTGYEPLSCSASNNNQLTTCSMGYDAAGNMTNNGSAAYSYDIENRLTATASYTYVYDGDGKRVKKATGSTGTLYWTGVGGDPISESDVTGPLKSEYIFFNGKRVARRDAADNSIHYYFSNHLGSHTMITSALGVIQKDTDYFPYGGEQNTTGTDTNHYKFTGKERDSESGLDNFGARYDASTLGRFMTPDPGNAGVHRINPQSWNAYTYVHNRPLSLVDPNGLEPVKAQAGSIHGFVQDMNNTPHKVGLTRGSDASHALASLGATENLGPKNTAIFNMSANRYVYTASGGWVDMVHFVYYAGRAAGYQAQGISNPVGSAVQDGYLQEQVDAFKAPWSAYSYEDLPSDLYGATFGAEFFDPTSPLTLGEQIEAFLSYLSPMDPLSAPNYLALPTRDSRRPPMARNHSTSPMFTLFLTPAPEGTVTTTQEDHIDCKKNPSACR